MDITPHMRYRRHTMKKKPQILVPSEGYECWQHLLMSPSKHWSDDHSAKAVARCWEDACKNTRNGLPREISKIVGAETKLILAIPEHKVPMPPNRKAPSQSDVFALLSMGPATCTLTVEAACDEPFDKEIGDWKKDRKNDGKSRLGPICEVLGCTDPPDHLRYQLFHRTASAIYEADRFKAGIAAMIVHSFPPHGGFDDFTNFCQHLGISQVHREVPMWIQLPSGRNLLLGWADGDKRYLK